MNTTSSILAALAILTTWLLNIASIRSGFSSATPPVEASQLSPTPEPQSDVAEEKPDRILAMFKSHVVNIAKAARVEEDEFIGWLTGEIKCAFFIQCSFFLTDILNP